MNLNYCDCATCQHPSFIRPATAPSILPRFILTVPFAIQDHAVGYLTRRKEIVKDFEVKLCKLSSGIPLSYGRWSSQHAVPGPGFRAAVSFLRLWPAARNVT